MNLTTPVSKDYDAAFPGENWFFYWKTSSSLWRSKLEASPQSGPVLIPINWAFHSDIGEKADFAQRKPETNLKRLTEVVESLGRKAVFLLPLTPAPFLPNGGVPHLLARIPSQNHYGLSLSVLQGEEQINKLYSFFDQRIFQAFSRFVYQLGEYFSREGIVSDIIGMECGYLEEGRFKSFFQDHSKAFEQAFTRYLDNKSRLKKEEGDRPHSLISDPRDEDFYKSQMTEQMFDLYESTAQEGLSGNYERTEKFCFLGASPINVFFRYLAADQGRDYTRDLLQIMALDLIPSSALLSSNIKKGILKKQLEEVIDQSSVEQKFSAQVFEDEMSVKFKKLLYFKLYEGKSNENWNWSDLGVVQAIKERYHSCYELHREAEFVWREDLNSEEINVFIRGYDITPKVFTSILRHFMSGGKVIIDKVGMSEEHTRKLETFFLENSLDVEKVNVQNIPVFVVNLGPGKLILFDLENLSTRDYAKKLEFWRLILKTMNILFLEVEGPMGLDLLWRTRDPSGQELRYQEIRRLSLYNPSSYKRKLKLPMGKNFVLTRVVNEGNVKISNSGSEVEIEFLPEGSVSLDLGVFS